MNMNMNCSKCGCVFSVSAYRTPAPCPRCGFLNEQRNMYPYSPSSNVTKPQGFMDPNTAFVQAANGSNCLNCQQLQRAIQYTGVFVSLDVCNQFIMKHDRDRNGTIDINEFGCVYAELNEWISVFNVLDTDRSGKLDYNEFKMAVPRLGYSLPDSLLNLIFSNLDSDHDGMLTLDGFIKSSSVLHIARSKMSQYDREGRGYITINFDQLLDILFSVPM